MSLVTNDIDLEALNRVDEVHSLITRLVENPKENDLLDKEVDKYLSTAQNKNSFNKTVINSYPNSGSDREGFLKELERDANERAIRKARSKTKADVIKKKANDYFNANDFEKAINYYSRAIEECKDYDILYTNRAQAYLKIEKTQEALMDCEMALRISPRNHKALLHKGRSLSRLNRFDEALESYDMVVEIAPQLKKYMDEFISESRALKDHFETKKLAENVFSGSQSAGSDLLTGILGKLAGRDKQCLEFFVGGLEIVLRLCDEHAGNVEQLRSDLKAGNGIFAANCQLRREIHSAVSGAPENLSEMQTSFLAAWLELLARTVTEDDAAIRAFFNGTVTVGCVPSFTSQESPSICLEQYCRLVAKQKSSSHLLLAAVTLLLRLSTSDIGLQQIFDRVAPGDLLTLTMRAVCSEKRIQLVSRAMALFENLARSHRFKVILSRTDHLVQPLIDCVHATLLASVTRPESVNQLQSVISIIDLLADNSAIRTRLILHNHFLDDCIKAIEARLPIYEDDKHASVLLQLFSTVHNLLARAKLATPVPDRVRSYCERVVTASSLLVSQPHSAMMRSMLIQVLAQMLPVLSDEQLTGWCDAASLVPTAVAARDREGAVRGDGGSGSGGGDDDGVSMCRSLSRQASLTDLGYLDKVCITLKLCVTVLDTAPSHPLLPDAIKLLALASKVSQAVRFLCCDVRERVMRLQALLCQDRPNKLDESMCGNICLLFMHCVVDTPLAEHVADTDIIKNLLRICNDATKSDCRRNAAIFAGKLAQSNHVHRAELSRLNGFSIVSRFNDWR